MPQTQPMDQLQEDLGIAKVVDHLTEQFPALGRIRVEQVVDGAHRLLSGNPIRDYVPVLVQRTAKDRLRRIMTDEPAAIPAV